jgi:hypothetical protein
MIDPQGKKTLALAPRPGRSVAKWGLTVKPKMKTEKDRAIMRGNALSLMPQAQAVPILWTLVKRARGKPGSRTTWNQDWTWKALAASEEDLEQGKWPDYKPDLQGINELLNANYSMTYKQIVDFYKRDSNACLEYLLKCEAEEDY